MTTLLIVNSLEGGTTPCWLPKTVAEFLRSNDVILLSFGTMRIPWSDLDGVGGVQ